LEVVMIRKFKQVAGERKTWNSGWPNRSKVLRKAVNRRIERAFRQTEHKDIAEQREV
jgi:hypothetical protein